MGEENAEIIGSIYGYGEFGGDGGDIHHLRMRRYPGDDVRGNACLNTVMDLVAF